MTLKTYAILYKTKLYKCKYFNCRLKAKNLYLLKKTLFSIKTNKIFKSKTQCRVFTPKPNLLL